MSLNSTDTDPNETNQSILENLNSEKCEIGKVIFNKIFDKDTVNLLLQYARREEESNHLAIKNPALNYKNYDSLTTEKINLIREREAQCLELDFIKKNEESIARGIFSLSQEISSIQEQLKSLNERKDILHNRLSSILKEKNCQERGVHRISSILEMLDSQIEKINAELNQLDRETD